MKTKNIFRMLLVAAALLMGANNVKATEETVWSGSSGEIYYGAIELSITNFTSKGVAVGKYLRVYTSERTNGWNFDIKTPSGTSLGFTNWQGESNNINVKTENCYNSTDNYFEFTISQTFIEQVTSLGFQIQCWNMIINRITISDTSGISGGGTSTTDVPVWTGSVWSGKWGENGSRVFLDNGTFSSLKCDGKDIIRVYGTLGDIGLDDWGNAWFIQFLGGNWQPQGGWECLNRSSNTVDGFTGYVDFEVTSEVASILKNNTNSSDGKCAILQGHNITFTSIVVNPSSTSTTTYSVTVNASSNGSASVNKSSAANGETVTVTISPNNGYALESISVVDASNNAVTLTGSGNTRTFIMPASNVTISTTFAEAHYLTFKTSEYCAAEWNEQNSTFSWGPSYPGWNNPAWNFMEAVNISGDLSGWTRLHLHVGDWNNASAHQLTVVFKTHDGSNPPSGPTKEFVVTPDEWGNIDINLEGIDWGNCDIYNIHDLTIYGCNRDNTSNDASVVVTDAYYLSSTPIKQNVTLSFTTETATATMGESYFELPTLIATVNNQTITGLDISYESSKTDVATVDPSTGVVSLVGPGITVITASFNGDEYYNAAQSVSYRLTVLEAAPTEDDYIDVDEENHAISFFGYRTYVTEEKVDFSRSIGVEGYYATGLNEAGTDVLFTQVTGICDKGVPLLLKAKSDANGVYKLLISSATVPAATIEALTNNKLQAGRTVNGQGEYVSGDNKYVLTVRTNEVVFAEVNIEGAYVDSKHAYLDLNNTNAARGRLTIRLKGESTGISNVETETIGDDVIYNLRGQRVEHPTKGLYIINGKKVVIK
jgi:hypothetical protein